jgi:TPR repeat protein
MRISRAAALSVMIMGSALVGAGPATAQVAAVDAAQAMASALDGAGGGIPMSEQVAALEAAAAAGDTMALWQLGLMYESGEGVAKDKAKAFSYFSQIADQHADAAPRGIEADIVAQSFVKMGDYYSEGVPEANIPQDDNYSTQLIFHAASYFGDADAQYRLGELFLDSQGLGDNPIQSARWLSLAARKGHAAAQAKLGDMLFNGEGDLIANPVEGLMWLTVASRRAVGTLDAVWINEKLNAAMSVADAEIRVKAVSLADTLDPRFGGL